MNFVVMLLSAIAGAGLMYLFDPNGGNRRRALMRDKATSVMNTTTDTVSGVTSDAKNRAKGMAHEVKSRVKGAGEVDDETLVARVRSEMGRYVSNPGAITVTANNGRITVTGPIAAGESQQFLKAIASVTGVMDVNNQLQIQEGAAV